MGDGPRPDAIFIANSNETARCRPGKCPSSTTRTVQLASNSDAEMATMIGSGARRNGYPQNARRFMTISRRRGTTETTRCRCSISRTSTDVGTHGMAAACRREVDGERDEGHRIASPAGGVTLAADHFCGKSRPDNGMSHMLEFILRRLFQGCSSSSGDSDRLQS